MDSSDQSRLSQERTCAKPIPGTIHVNASFGGLVELKHLAHVHLASVQPAGQSSDRTSALSIRNTSGDFAQLSNDRDIGPHALILLMVNSRLDPTRNTMCSMLLGTDLDDHLVLCAKYLCNSGCTITSTSLY